MLPSVVVYPLFGWFLLSGYLGQPNHKGSSSHSKTSEQNPWTWTCLSAQHTLSGCSPCLPQALVSFGHLFHMQLWPTPLTHSPQLGLLKCPELQAEYNPWVWLVGPFCPHWQICPEPPAVVRTSIRVAWASHSLPLPPPLGFSVPAMTLLSSMLFPRHGPKGNRTKENTQKGKDSR